MKYFVSLVLSGLSFIVVQPALADSRSDAITEIRALAEDISVKVGTTSTDTSSLSDMIDQLRLVSARLEGDGENDELLCQPYAGNAYAYVTRASDLQKLGSYVDASVCRKIVQNARAGFVCEPYSGSAYAFLTRTSDGRHFGNYLGMNACFNAVATTTPELLCQPYSGAYAYVTRTSDFQTLGSYVQMRTCQRILQSATSRYVCQPYDGDAYAYLTQIATGTTIGSYQSMNACLANIPR